MKNYWRTIKEREADPGEIDYKSEFTDENHPVAKLFDEGIVNAPASRRNFLKMFGFSITAATLAASCENKVTKAIPYLVKPEEITPGKATYYASSFMDGNDFCSVVVKTREGRPIKIEGNQLSSITAGGTNARTQASVLTLYDTERLQNPLYLGNETSWEQLDGEIIAQLNDIAGKGEQIVLLTPSVYSPSTQKAIDEFIAKYPGSKQVSYDPVSASAIIMANKENFGKAVIPSYHFEHAEMIVGFGADFLGTWLSPVEYIRQYAKNRKVSDEHKKMSKHIHFESRMSLTGSNADERIIIKPSEEGLVLANLLKAIQEASGQESITIPQSPVSVDQTAGELMKHKGKSLVVSGSSDPGIQMLVNKINTLLGNYGKTIDLNTALNTRKAIDQDFADLVKDLNEDKVKALFIYGVNPLYSSPMKEAFKTGLERPALTVSFAPTLDETASQCRYVCPDSHYLESWNDAEPKNGHYSLMQPAIQPLFNTRQFAQTLLVWSENQMDYDDFIQANWEKNIFPKQDKHLLFRNFWTKSLQDGVFEIAAEKMDQPAGTFELDAVVQSINNKPRAAGFELSFYEKVAIGDGRHANNPWLQEMPDPISKNTWDNYINISPKQAKEMRLEDGDVVNINNTIQLPVFVQPGQAYGTVSIAYGYGRTKAGRVGDKVGENVYGLIHLHEGCFQNNLSNVKLDPIGFNHPIATTQSHHSMEGRKIVREATLEEYSNDSKAGNEFHHEFEHHHKKSMYKEHYKDGHHWGLMVDLNSCTGCGNCVIACQAENNVPVVGKEEVMINREMHWIRIDRYYNGDPENPETVFQPLMCQQCDNAPCENVCPTVATNHSSEGLNQMTYNRCVGTKYCANNCPYKVRRFNWFDYTEADAIKANLHDPAGMMVDLKRMVLNPDVTVRAKGVMEKCSFCVQRIQDKKLDAKIEGRPLKDMEIQTACMQSCPSSAIIFGDMNDKEAKVAKMMKDDRNYHLLEELHVLPTVGYLTKIRNKT